VNIGKLPELLKLQKTYSYKPPLTSSNRIKLVIKTCIQNKK